MKKKIMALAMAMAMAAGSSMTAFAAGWQHDAKGWWYQNDDGTWPSNTWMWIDGDRDGTAESYYFNSEGYAAANTITPDGYTVNGDGAWTVDGAVQTQVSNTQAGAAQAAGTPTSQEIVDYLCHDVAYQDMGIDKICNLEVDPSRPAAASGVTNIRYKLYRGDGAGWIYHIYRRNTTGGCFYCAIAIDENGYLMVNTTTPDGFYVNKYGVLEINGQEVTHDSSCRMVPNVPDKRDKYGNPITDPNNYDVSNCDFVFTNTFGTWANRRIPFGQLVYNHYGSSVAEPPYWDWNLGFGTCTDVTRIQSPKTAGVYDGPEPRVR